MRLKAIKLSGFKSFVDPTLLKFPSNLIGIVGPNGCGKSNTIDAVRWVMGESSAKHLRGGSMEDVIFNGSQNRKPISHAAVELIFDNSEGRLQSFANYNEISVKREAYRDGESRYYLNSSRCRKKDITDLFLGTGLGSRSYAIIEQGMISRIIEAKPEDLRIYIEEAAGISKYKERRKETESRMQQTQENLQRLDDIMQELSQQVEKLQKQAHNAEIFIELKAQERKLKAEIILIKWLEYAEEIADIEEKEKDLSLKTEKFITEQRTLEIYLEQARQEQEDLQQQAQDYQQQFFQFNTKITNLEKELQEKRSQYQINEQNLTAFEKNIQDYDKSLIAIKQEITKYSQQEKDLSITQQELAIQEENVQNLLEQGEKEYQQWQQQWQQYHNTVNEFNKVLEVEDSKLQGYQREIKQYTKRIERLQGELQTINQLNLHDNLNNIQLFIEEKENNIADIEIELQIIDKKLTENKENHKQTQKDQKNIQKSLNDLNKEILALQALQKASLGNSYQEQLQWLDNNKLYINRLQDILQVQSPWQKAVEVILQDKLQAMVFKEDIFTLENKLDDIYFLQYDNQSKTYNKDSLLYYIQPNSFLIPWLENIFIAENLDFALQNKNKLTEQQSFITQQGIWIGKNWLKTPVNKKPVLLEKLALLKQLQAQYEIEDEKYNELIEKIEVLEQEKQSLEHKKQVLQKQYHEDSKDYNQYIAQAENLQNKVTQNQEQKQILENEIQELQDYLTELLLEHNQSQEKYEKANQSLSQQQSHKQNLQQQNKKSYLQELQQQQQNLIQKQHEISIQLTEVTTKKQGNNDQEQKLLQTHIETTEKIKALKITLTETWPLVEKLEKILAETLEQRLQLEQMLQEQNNLLQEKQQYYQKQERQHQTLLKNIQAINQNLQEIRLSKEGFKAHQQSLEQQIQETEYELKTLALEIDRNAEIETWQISLHHLQEKITKLGTVNLTAIEEYKTEKTRYDYLQQQQNDLQTALDSLNNAIAKLDQETKQRFKAVFDQVNDKIKQRFPRLFGGGEAYLALTGEDLLTSGVAIMARPPGKKITTIHLMSGGEKALTAVAMIFAIFELNPAPFCMLDEVDAPLDDANVIRFSNMVEELSSQVQFIFITHNKRTMEIAKQLIGVTMREPGVSRLVSVDIEQAIQMTK